MLHIVYFLLSSTVSLYINLREVLINIILLETFGVIMPFLGVFPNVRAIFKRERASGSYRASSAYLSKIISNAPLTLIGSLLLTVPVYWMVGLQPYADLYFTFILIVVIHSLTALSLGFCIGSAVPTAQVGQILGPLIITIFLVILFSIGAYKLLKPLTLALWRVGPKYRASLVGFQMDSIHFDY